MINVLIADDEHHVVNYIASLLEPRQDIDLQIFKVYSGIEALDLIKETKFDLVLLDINMPGASGLEVAEQVSNMWPRTRILFLTAYDNFEYIYKAVSFKCCGYILKAETDQTIINRIDTIIDDIKADLLNFDIKNKVTQKTIYLSHLLHQNILRGILSGWSEDKIKNEISMLTLDIPIEISKPFYLMYSQSNIEIGSSDHIQYTDPILSYIQLMELLLCQKFTCQAVQCNQQMVLWLFQPKDIKTSSTDILYLKHVADDFINTIYAKGQAILTAFLYDTAVDFKSLSHVYDLLQHYVCQFNHTDEQYVCVLGEAELQHMSSQNERSIKSANYLDKIFITIHNGDKTGFFKALKVLREQCVTIKSMHSLTTINIYFSISIILMRYIEQNRLREALAMKTAIYPLFNSNYSSWDEAFDFLTEIAQKLFELTNIKKATRNEHVILIIKDFIQQNLYSEITLCKISELVNYNESYISRLFKTSTGEGVCEYINRLRLEKVKELLKTTNLSIQNIADMTGFDTSQYFSSVFKKNIGKSPTDYRIYSVI